MSRGKKLLSLFPQNNIDALLISNFYNILYLTGFKTLSPDEREAWVLVTDNHTYILTDGRYINLKNKKEKIKNANKKTKIIYRQLNPDNHLLNQLKELIRREKISKLGFETDDLRVAELKKFTEKIPEVKWQETEKLIIKLREIKEKEEVEKIKKACQIVDNCLKEITKVIKVGMSEKEIAFKIEFYLKRKGFDLAFYPIVAIDKNSSLPHYNTKEGEGRVRKNSVILIDFGARYQDYNSDITRMIFISPTREMINVYEKLLTIQEKTITVLRRSQQDGIPLNKIDQFCRKLLEESLLPNYSHFTGHGVGLEIHEYPKISQNSTDTLRPGQVFTIEPGVYFAEKWGMRVEDTVWINNNLKPEVLTKFSKKPFIFKL